MDQGNTYEGAGSGATSGASSDAFATLWSARMKAFYQHSKGLAIFAGILGVMVIGFIFITTLEQQKESTILPSQGAASVLVILQPEVSIKNPGTESFAAVSAEDIIPVAEGAEVLVAQNGQAAILYPNGTLTTLGGGSHVVIDELKGGGEVSKMTLLAGTMWARVERLMNEGETYEVRANGFVTSVRGTEFELALSEDGKTAISVLNSVVSLAPLDANGLTLASEAVEIGGGEKIAFTPATATKKDLETLKTDIPTALLQDAVLAHALVDQGLESTGVRAGARDTLGGLVSAGMTPDSPFYFLEELSELVGTVAAVSGDAKARRYMALAEERLAEVEALSARGGQDGVGIDRALNRYDSELAGAIAESKTARGAETSEIVARATAKHITVLERVIERVPEEARGFVRNAQSLSRIGHVNAVEALGEKDPTSALAVIAETADRRLREAQARAAQGKALGMFDALQDYDRLVRLGGELQVDNAEFAETYAEEVNKTLRTVETLNTLAENLPPGYKRTTEEIRMRSIENQLSSIATVAEEKPEKAVALFANTADYYLEKAQDRSRAGDKKEAQAALESYEEYADFGAKIAGLAKNIGSGETSVKELVQQATAHHEEVLKTVRSQVPVAAQEAITRSISNIEKVRTGRVEAVTLEEFKEQHTPTKFDDLESPAAPAVPEAAPKVEDKVEVRTETRTGTSPTIPAPVRDERTRQDTQIPTSIPAPTPVPIPQLKLPTIPSIVPSVKSEETEVRQAAPAAIPSQTESDDSDSTQPSSSRR